MKIVNRNYEGNPVSDEWREEIDWKWFFIELKRIFRKTSVNPKCIGNDENVEDLVQDTILILLKQPNLAEKIYEENNVNLLASIAKKQIFKSRAKLYFSNKEAFSRYQKVLKVCEMYQIEAIPENAYKISGLIENNHHLTIALVESLLTNVKQRVVDYEKEKELS